MGAIVSSTTFYAVERSLSAQGTLTYYQLKALSTFVDLVCLHDSVTVLTPLTSDQLEQQLLYRRLSEMDGMNVTILHPRDAISAIGSENFHRYISQVYQRPLGITNEEIGSDTPKDRYAEDIGEKFETMIAQGLEQDALLDSASSLGIWASNNSGNSELHYILRGHLQYLYAKKFSLTPCHVGLRLFTVQLDKLVEGDNFFLGDLSYRTFYLADEIIANLVRGVTSPANYPNVSILFKSIAIKIDNRKDIFPEAQQLRAGLIPFRSFYLRIEDILKSSDASLHEKAGAASDLSFVTAKVWSPVAKYLLGDSYSPRSFTASAKRIVAGPLDVLDGFSLSTGGDEGLDFDYESPSLLKLVSSIVSSSKDEILIRRVLPAHEKLLEVLHSFVREKGIAETLAQNFEVRNFNLDKYRIIDKVEIVV